MLLSLIDFVSSYLEGTEHKSYINLTGFQTNSWELKVIGSSFISFRSMKMYSFHCNSS